MNYVEYDDDDDDDDDVDDDDDIDDIDCRNLHGRNLNLPRILFCAYFSSG